jgi:hypothetical protein
MKYRVSGTTLYLTSTTIEFSSVKELNEFLLLLLTQTEGLPY